MIRMENLSNFFGFIRIALILIIGGTAFKACISLLEGKKVVLNPLNPLDLKARWPRQKQGKSNLDQKKES